MQSKHIHEQITLQTRQHGAGFRSSGLNSRQMNLDPILNIDLFQMSRPIFPPHPHAGFSAVTYLLPESQGSFQNRDSLGDRSMISPGAIHWTQAGSGVMHEEIPAVPGVDVWGFQIFVNLKPEAQVKPPRILHAEPGEIPALEYAAGSVRVVAGSHQGRSSPLHALDTPVVFLDVRVEAQSTLTLRLEHPYAYFAFGIAGTGMLAGQGFGASQAAILSREGDEVVLSAHQEALRVFIGGGEPLRQSVYWDGPFAMSTHAETLQARQRFLAGEMGHLSPSF